MEYIISGSTAPSGDIYEDETYCTRGLCPHPCCWESHIRQTRGFRKYVSLSADSPLASKQQVEDEDGYEGLSTMKVLNMLDEYGESPKDLYPSRHKGLPTHKQQAAKTLKKTSKIGRIGPKRPRCSPLDAKGKIIDDILEPASVKQVEVQEVFDLEELSQNWDCTFVTRPMYVWVPGKQKPQKKRKQRSSAAMHSSISDHLAMKNITDDMLPREQYRQHHPPPPASVGGAPQAQPRSRSPLPTGGQPYHNVGQTPKDRMRFRVIMNELKDLPRPFVIEVLEKARGMDKKEDVLMMMERYLKTMRKSDWELSMVTGKVLQQQRLDSKMLEHAERLNQVPINQIYKLDENEQDEETQHALSAVPADVLEGSICSSNKYKPLPDIAVRRKRRGTVRVHVSTTTQESVKPFQYRKQANLEFCLGPTRSFSTGLSRTHSERTIQSDREPTIPGADMSVLYDQESLDRNTNNNNISMKSGQMQAGGEGTLNNSRASCPLPTAPAGTPYTPKTPYKDKSAEKAEVAHSTPDAVVLEAIQEMTVVDEFGTETRKIAKDPELRTKSVMETRSVVSPIKRRVVSANQPRVSVDGSLLNTKRAQSANISTAVAHPSSVGQGEQVSDAQPGQANRVMTSRLDIISTTSNWPTVDEEALLREQMSPKPEPARVVSAPNKKQAAEKQKRPATQPVSAREKEPQKTTIVVNLQPLQMTESENSPAPPPPSPEPADRLPQSTLVKDDNSTTRRPDSTDQSQSTRPAVIDLSDLSDLPPATGQSDSTRHSISQSQPSKEHINESPAENQSGVEQKGANGKNLAGQDDQSADHAGDAERLVSQSEEIEGQQGAEFDEKLKFSMNIKNGVDSLSLVPESLYREMDMEREITLSVLPPSVLVTPDLSTANLRQLEVTSPTKDLPDTSTDDSSALPTLAQVMKLEDQGGLSGQ